MTGLSVGAGAGDRGEVPLARLRQRDRHRLRRGRRAGRRSRSRIAHLTGGGFDLPPLEPLFEEYVSPMRARRPPQLPPGDFFADPLPHGRRAHHGAHPARLEPRREAHAPAKAYDALPDGGALIVYDAIIDDDRRENAFGLLMSLNMLIETTGGFDYTGADCRGWMARSGLPRDATSNTWSVPTRWWSESSKRSRGT